MNIANEAMPARGIGILILLASRFLNYFVAVCQIVPGIPGLNYIADRK